MSLIEKKKTIDDKGIERKHRKKNQLIYRPHTNNEKNSIHAKEIIDICAAVIETVISNVI